MNKQEIGINAGIVWHLLSDNSKWSFAKLKKASGLNDKELFAAIGWLAREDKIELAHNEKDEVRIFMNINVFIG